MNGNMYLALDFPTWEDTKQFIDKYELHGVPVKVGMELFYREGPRIIDKLKQDNHAIFLDLKLHDIPATVMKAMKNLAALDVDLVNVHALGGGDMIQCAKEGLMAGKSGEHETKLIAVTLLTSIDETIMHKDLKMQGSLADNVTDFSSFARQHGADGVVCSVHEANRIKAACGPSFLTVTPGIRLPSSGDNDQKRAARPCIASEYGSDIIVVGRTITDANNPKMAYGQVQKEWENGIKS